MSHLRGSKKRLQTECNKTPVYTGQKRARQQDTPQSAKVHINKNYEKVFRVRSNDTEISNKKLKSKTRNLQQQLRRCKSKIANMPDVIDSLEQNLIVKTEIATHYMLRSINCNYLFSKIPKTTPLSLLVADDTLATSKNSH